MIEDYIKVNDRNTLTKEDIDFRYFSVQLFFFELIYSLLKGYFQYELIKKYKNCSSYTF